MPFFSNKLEHNITEHSSHIIKQFCSTEPRISTANNRKWPPEIRRDSNPQPRPPFSHRPGRWRRPPASSRPGARWCWAAASSGRATGTTSSRRQLGGGESAPSAHPPAATARTTFITALAERGRRLLGGFRGFEVLMLARTHLSLLGLG